MRKLMIILIILMIPKFAYADYQINNRNDIVVNSKIIDTNNELVSVNENMIDETSIINALDKVNFRYNGDFTVHIIDYHFYTNPALGLALENNIILFDFIPYELDMLMQTTVVHELGHLVYMQMNDCQKEEYKELREIPKEWDNYPKTSYINRPQEIFAEDFRILFGGEESTVYSHSNQTLKNPKNVRGLKRFIRQFELKEVTNG